MTKTKKRSSAVKDKSPVGKVARVVETKQDVITKASSESDRRTVEMFLANKGEVALPVDDLESHRMRLASKLLDEYAVVKDIPQEASKEKTGEALLQSQQQGDSDAAAPVGVDNVVSKLLAKKIGKDASALVRYKQIGMPEMEKPMSRALSLRRELAKPVEPTWHAPWKLMRVISGHLGWVRSVAVDPTNMFFATGSADRTIKVWDLASGSLKLTLTGHINAVRALEFSERYTYMFSAGEDKLVKCWDLEYNKVIRHYHGHYTGVYALKLHPTLDLLVTGGRDSSARVWDIRSRKQVHLLGGHKGTVHSLLTQGVNPQVVTGSMDGTIKLWDLVAGKVMTTLTNHKKGVRSLVAHPREFTFASGAADNIKKWKFPQGVFMQNLSDHNSIINTLSINDDNVLVSGGNDGTVCFWDWPSGHCFQSTRSQAQPGSLDSEAGILASCFDRSGSRLITCEADKSIKVWKEDETATPETHPLEWKVNENARKY